MNRKCRQYLSRTLTIITLGTALLIGGCTLDTTSLANGILGSVVNSTVGGFVCERFNLPDAACSPSSLPF